MVAIPVVSLSGDAVAISTTPGTVGPSSALTSGAPYLVLAMGHARTTAGLGDYATLTLTVDNVAFARYRNSNAFGTPASGGLGAGQLGAAFTYTPGGSGHVLEVDHVADGSGEAESIRAYALDLSLLPLNDGRWHSESENSDTIVTTPTSGYTTLGSAGSGVLEFTPPRSGAYLIIASVEAVANGSAAAGDTVGIRLQVDGVTSSGSVSEGDLPPDPAANNFVDGYLVARVVTLTAGVQSTIQLQATNAGAGTVGYRRIRIHALEVAAFEHGDVQSDTDTDGETATNTTPFQSGGISITLNPPASRSYLLLATMQAQYNFWAEHHFYLGGANERPTNGFGRAANDNGIAAGDDMTMMHGLHVESGVSSSTSLQLRIQRLGGATNNVYGAACARSGAGDIVCIAVRLALADRGDLEAELPLPTAAMAGHRILGGSFEGMLPVVEGELDGSVAHLGTLGATLPIVAADFVGSIAHVGALNGSLPLLELDAEGTRTGAIDGSLAGALPIPLMLALDRRARRGVSIASGSGSNAVIPSSRGLGVTRGPR